MRVILAAVERPLAAAFEAHCGGLEGVEVHAGSIFDVACDAVVSPANSFGFMDGGIDYLFSKHFGWHVQERLQTAIREKHHGELLVGQAEVVETDDPEIPYLIAAPTMRVPMILTNSVNPFLAARAALRAAVGHPKIDSIAIPGLGTGVGRISPEVCAWQVRAALKEVLFGKGAFPFAWADACRKHESLYAFNSRRSLE